MQNRWALNFHNHDKWIRFHNHENLIIFYNHDDKWIKFYTKSELDYGVGVKKIDIQMDMETKRNEAVQGLEKLTNLRALKWQRSTENVNTYVKAS